MKRKLIYRLASLGLAISCALVSIPVEGLSGVLTVYAEEVKEPVESMEETTETVESTEETTEIVEPIEETTETVEPLVETEEPTQEVDDVYFDAANGVSYYYYGYSDGTATIYNMTFSNGAILEFPTTINSYTVTKINCSSIASNTNRMEVSSIRIPESITYIGGSPFTYLDIGTLFYNTNATNIGYATGAIFVNATISNLVIGNNVEYIDTWTFDGAKFLFDELTLSVKTIGHDAFRKVWDETNPGKLTIADEVETIEYNAFAMNHFSTVNYDCSAVSNAWSLPQGVFYHSYITELNFGETSTNIGDYMFCEIYPSFYELTVDVPSVGEGAFAKLWTSDQKATLTLTEDVTYIEDTAFMQNNFSTVNYNCNASMDETYGPSGVFYHSNIDELLISSTVTVIPRFMFNQTYLNFDSLTIDVESIGERAFGSLWAEQQAGTLTLTERVNFISDSAFAYGNYAMLNYNANADSDAGYDLETIFYQSKIGDLAIGSNVTKLPGWLFYKSIFGCDEINVNVETIGECTFGHLWEGQTAGTLNLGERVSYIYPSAFSYGNYAVVNYKANADGESGYNTESIFYQSNVGELNIDESVTKLPGWLFYYTYFGCEEITVNVETIGERAFGFLWNTSEAGTLNLGERVSYIYPGAFTNGNYKVVNYKADADGQSKNSSDSIFGSSKIAELNIGTNVTKIPNFLFYKAVFMFQELTVDVENIGTSAFGYVWTNDYPAILTIGSRVQQIKAQAFGSNVIEDLNYNSNATTDVSSSSGPFYLSTIQNLDIGENVNYIGNSMFNNSKMQDTDVVINVKTLDAYAFTGAWTSGYPVNLTIGETVEVMNTRAFANNYMNKLQYNAKNSTQTTTATGYNGPFNGNTITELTIGNTVEKIQAYTFYGIKLTQEDLKIPNSVTYMGKSVFHNSNLNITNLYIGTGLEELKSDTFGQGLVLSNIYVEALKGNDTYKGTSLVTNAIKNQLPVAENVYIHTNSDFHYYFTVKATNVISSCVDHMKETVGEEYLDEATAQYITPTYDTCEICKYQTTAFAYEDAYVVRFYVEGSLYHTVYTKNGGSVDAPTEPEKTGYNFKGWDAEFSNVTENTDVNAVFEVVKHTVTFKDYDGTVIETQTIEHGSPAFEPSEPTRAGHTFTGWDKTFDNITADTEITATYDVNYYNVVFQDHDGTKLSEQTVAYGSGATAPENPTREGYNFTGWDTDFSNITGDTTVTAKYRIKILTVIFKVFNDIFSTQEVEYGAGATDPGEPTAVIENWGRWIFTGWDNTWDYITDNLIVNAIMEQEYNTYTVTFQDADGSMIDTQTVKYGDYVVVPEDPVREGHTFSGWGGGNINLPIAEDMTFIANYEPIHFTATFVDEEGTVLSEVTFGYFGGPNVLFSVEQKEGHTVMWKPSVEISGYEYLTSNMVTEYQFKQDVTLTLYYKPDVFSIQFLDWDGTVLKEESVEYGKSATPPEDPVRKGYTFKEWGDGSYDFINAGVGFIAQYDINYYTVTFVDYDGTVLSTQEIHYQGSANAPVDPVREGCDFTGWDTDYSSIEEDITVTAQYNTNKYTVRFEDYDGTELDVKEVEHGNAVVPPETPTREGYTFIGWDKSTDNITGNTVIKATYQINEYTVTFVDYDGSLIDTQTVTHGSDATVPEHPVREGYDFTGWDKEYTNITEDTEITAVYAIKVFTVVFKDIEKIISTQQIEYGKDATKPAIPSREEEDWGIWVFKEWDNTWTDIKENREINAVFEKQYNQYTVTFVDDNGSVIDTQTITHGSDATLPEAPAKEGYTFISWDKSAENILEDTIITAIYEINEYTVTFLDYDGTLIDTQNVTYGSDATVPEHPVREGYDFTGWDKTYTNITEDTEITATYAIKVFTVVFKDNDKIISTQQIEYGKDATEPAIPSREEEEWGVWIFKEWDNTWTDIKENREINAVFEKKYNQYTVTFVDYDGSVLKTETLIHGKAATAPENPTREGHIFKEWDKDYSKVVGNMTITAVYEANLYTVTFVDYDGSIIDTQSVKYQESAVLPKNPLRLGYTFREWVGTWENITRNCTVTAAYDTNIYTVDFVDHDGTLIASQSVEFGKGATAPESPTREGHTFKGWDKDYSKVVGNMTITAVYEANSYTVTFVDYDGSVIDTQSVKYQESAVIPENPVRVGYTFKEWQGTWENITEDTTVIATYVINTYRVDFVDYDGSVIDTQKVKYQESATLPENPTRVGYTFKGWIGNWENITENSIVKASYEINVYTVDFVDYDGTLIESQTIEYEKGATAPTKPVREGYTFLKWDKDFSKITEDTTITAIYEISTYTVTFVDYDGLVIDTQSVKYQQSAALPENPTRIGYTFKEWQGTWENVTEDSTVTATYDINVYTVDFVDHDGTLIVSQSVEYGKGATAPEEPVRDGYTFLKWDKDFSKITENLTIIAVYEKNHVHEYVEETERKESTCFEKGYVISKCSCGETETKELDVDLTNHSGETEVRDKKAATCTEKGYTGDTYCKSCDSKISDGEETDLEEHTPGETKVENRVEPTTEAKGSYDEVIYCEICSKELSRTPIEIPMLEPDEPEDSEEPSEPEEPEDSEEPSEPEEPEDSEEPSDPEEPEDTEEPSESEEPEDTEQPIEPSEPEKDEEESSIEDIVIPIVAGTGVAGGSTMLAIVYWRRRRKVYGNFLDEQGNPIVNAKVYLEGKDVLETQTDENGFFEFKNLKAGMYKFMLCNDLDVLLVEAELYTDEKNVEEAVTIIESKCEVEFEKEHNNISFIITHN